MHFIFLNRNLQDFQWLLRRVSFHYIIIVIIYDLVANILMLALHFFFLFKGGFFIYFLLMLDMWFTWLMHFWDLFV